MKARLTITSRFVIFLAAVIAALETGDSLTVAYEAPSYQNMLGAEYLALADTLARLIFAGGNIRPELFKASQANLSRRPIWQTP